MRLDEALGLLRSLALYRRPGRQRRLRQLYGPFVGNGDLVFDVGAHLGDRSVAFAALGARVIALEPNPRIARWLERLVAGHDRIHVRREAVGRHEGRAELALSRRTPTVATLARAWRERMPDLDPAFRHVRWEEVVDVPVTTLDALVEEHGLPRFCKIDVEGYEAEVLAGLSHPVDGISVEFLRGDLKGAVECVRRLESLAAYEFNTVLGEGRSFRFDRWQSAEATVAWLHAGGDGAPSGDIYARRLH